MRHWKRAILALLVVGLLGGPGPARAAKDTLVIGTDYGHTDPSSDVDAIMTFKARTDLSETQKEKILCDNARALYGI